MIWGKRYRYFYYIFEGMTTGNQLIRLEGCYRTNGRHFPITETREHWKKKHNCPAGMIIFFAPTTKREFETMMPKEGVVYGINSRPGS